MAPEINNNENAMPGGISIVPKVVFHIDSFFEDIRSQFDAALKKILDNSEVRLSDTKDFESYKILQEIDLNEVNQAVSLLEEDTNIKIALDVKDFAEGDVKVGVTNENQLRVEGAVESKEGNSYFKKSFYRSFPIPGVTKTEDITTALSSDGVLTISIPKKMGFHDTHQI